MSLQTFLKDPLPIRRWAASILARLPNRDDRECFRELWEVHRKVPGFSGTKKEKEAADQAGRDAVIAEFERLKRASERETFARLAPVVEWLPANGKYVIFSDYHIAPDGNRHDYFKKFHNDKLYCFILVKYFLENYTLIENGDVEELVIFEPTLAEARRQGRLDIEKPGDLNELENHRLDRRLQQLEDVIKSFTGGYRYNFYKLIGDSFVKKGRYFRTVGNHDDDTKRGDFDRKLEKAYGGKVRACDYVFIESAVRNNKGPLPAFMILHGNQFDPSTTPAIAPVSGELHSECLAWAYEGADRIWEWATHGKEWVMKLKSFNNRLVSIEPATLTQAAVKVLRKVALNPSLLETATSRNATWRVLRDQEVFAIMENIQGHVIAWEYLLGNSAIAKLERIFTKKEFFKFRHTDEHVIWEQMKRLFGNVSSHPVLVLGHTHEVRHHPMAPDGTAYAQYMNTGSAGRFENLIWAVEIDNGQARVVSWSFEEFPGGDKLRKLLWTKRDDRLVPSVLPV